MPSSTVPVRVIQKRSARLAEELDERPPEQVRAMDIVETAARWVCRRRADVEVSTDVLPEKPEYTLVRESRNASPLVTGTRGRGGIAETLLGSVSPAVAGHAHRPTVVVRGSHDNRAMSGTHGRVVVGAGEKPAASAAMRFAFEEARHRAAPVEAVRAWRSPAHEATGRPLLAGEPARLHQQQAVETLDEALRDILTGVDAHGRTVEGHTRAVLVDASRDTDLLVIGARRGRRHFGLQSGRVVRGVLHHSACPVVIVPEPTHTAGARPTRWALLIQALALGRGLRFRSG
ncbi:universal stress protein [Streptomyces incanus]|uniref:Universal stress protein n=1 Tax=Streptomyces incanus TaxID=887453 RepID=A0ABW0XJE8_9ACTN